MKKKHFFIINPVAGKGKAVDLEERLYKLRDELKVDLEVIFTKEALAGQAIARDLAKLANDDLAVKIYGCGGDGTLNEVVNGAYGYKNVEIGIVPTGTGNDYIRNFGTEEDFLDLKRQILGRAIDVDLVEYTLYRKGYENNKMCINMINIGFDAQVVVTAKKIKGLPFVGGGMAYGFSALLGIFERKMAKLSIRSNNGELHNGKVLLIAVGKGAYCGGGFKSLVKAQTNDGLMDLGLVKYCTRREMISLLTKYKNGTHIDTKVGKRIVVYEKIENLDIETWDEDIYISIDGEIEKAKRVELNVKKSAIKFIVPSEN